MKFLDSLYFNLTYGVKRFFHEEDGAVDIVAIVVMIGIAVLLATVFKDQISGLITKLIDTVKDEATDAVTSN